MVRPARPPASSWCRASERLATMLLDRGQFFLAALRFGQMIKLSQDRYPTAPGGYFGADALRLLEAFERDLKAGKLTEPLAAFPFSPVAATLVNSWSAPAARIYANWLDHIAQCKRNPTAAVRRAL